MRASGRRPKRTWNQTINRKATPKRAERNEQRIVKVVAVVVDFVGVARYRNEIAAIFSEIDDPFDHAKPLAFGPVE